jgi:hypothetical protein
MKNWLSWAGLSFIIGGTVSFALTIGTTGSFSEDISGYSIGWILVGTVLIIIGYIKKKNPAET